MNASKFFVSTAAAAAIAVVGAIGIAYAQTSADTSPGRGAVAETPAATTVPTIPANSGMPSQAASGSMGNMNNSAAGNTDNSATGSMNSGTTNSGVTDGTGLSNNRASTERAAQADRN